MVSTNALLAAIGFVVGAIIGRAIVSLMLDSGRHSIHRDPITHHPVVRVLSSLVTIGCGAVVAYFAYGLAS